MVVSCGDTCVAAPLRNQWNSSAACVGQTCMPDFLSEHSLHGAVGLLVRLVEAAGALVIFAGALIGFVRFLISVVRSRDARSFVPVRLDLGRFLALGLEFQLGSDLLRTAVAPTFAEIGQLAAVAAIRTALNFFLGREIREERDEIRSEREGTAGPQSPPP
ncbi:MAG TPA: DUF1622 domain-containing protein [Polyangiales bacterium]|nr:DUF1622 domain-containing protein [Polyangiales bacterium]